ncbi:hypothetical protein [Faecalicoccus pleomorphus]|uniref:hypothetical protein n=1 Tax=Faecalicoccus pleomorphus TaxID=1323 RepID=UPI00195FE686|nr:hypothetical protein [Faecalicoccus pleomorphus]MBM6808674.1 hypothetical protein [Faecalicoccus pleomorphus]
MEEILSSEKSVMEYLEILFLSQRSYEQRIEILEKKYGIMFKEESEMRKMCTFSDTIWEKGIEKGEEKGISIGREEGQKQVVKIGFNEGIRRSVMNLMKNHVTSNIEEAMDLLGVETSLRPAILKSIQIHE